jgi:hypothetical protein
VCAVVLALIGFKSEMQVLVGIMLLVAAAQGTRVEQGAASMAAGSLVQDYEACYQAIATSTNTNVALQAAINAGTTGLTLIPESMYTEAQVKLKQTVSGWTAELILNRSESLPPGPDNTNTQIIGAHVHTGNAQTNGPINVNFCSSSPLPPPATEGVSGCPQTEAAMQQGIAGQYDSTANAATAVPGATTLATGAATTLITFDAAVLEYCSSVSTCDAYFNFHTNYSFTLNPGAFGIARGQLSRVPCDKSSGAAGLYVSTAGMLCLFFFGLF